MRVEIASLEAEKTRLMTKADDYSQAKASLDVEISSAMEQYEIDNSTISASRKRLEQINSRIPEIKFEISSIEQARGDIDAQILKIKESINETNLKKNHNLYN